ncbi:MAG: threonine synthase [Deinococcota bacterium]|nr:threonine synthase [Deinococcota bacterium]
MTSPRYLSTRDPARRLVSFESALLCGLAPDGGLYLPDRVPEIVPEAWQGAATLPELGARILSPWLAAEVGEGALAAILDDALSFAIPLVPLADDLYLLELFHGPTLSFKDVAARTMARLMNHFLARRQEKVTVLVATSGDTGSAVADGFAGQANLEVVLLYPKGQVSPVQERQLIVRRPGVRACAVAGSFDDCQRLVKAAFADKALAGLALSSANSINVARLLPQSLYYFWALRALSRLGKTAPPLVCVPSGNLGNVTSGVLARLMGLPLRRFIAAHNANDFFPRYLEGSGATFKPSVQTLSNAMDVGAPSNFERLRALLGERLPDYLRGASVSDEATRARMRQVYETWGYVADPHTAVGLEAALRYREGTGDTTPTVVLATAHPAKFPEVVGGALAVLPPKVDRLERLWDEPTAVEALEPRMGALRAALLERA